MGLGNGTPSVEPVVVLAPARFETGRRYRYVLAVLEDGPSGGAR